MALRSLDTRGFMDGAIGGYEAMDRIYSRRGDQERADEEREYRREQDRIATERQRQRDEEGDRRWQATFDADQESKAEQSSLREAQLKAAKAQEQAANYSVERQRKLDFQSDNIHLLQEGTQTWAETGEVPEIFDHEYIKGSKYDPRTRNLLDLNRTKNYAGLFGQVLSGQLDLNSPEFLSATTDYIGDSINRNVGQVDPVTGKAITRTEIGQISIMPNEGGEDFMAVMLNVTYDDGSTAQRPLTEGRSTSPDDDVLLVPASMVAQSIMDDVKHARYIAGSKAYSELYQSDNGALRESLLALEEERTKALSDPLTSEEQREQINASFDEQAQRIRLLYHDDTDQTKALDNEFQVANEWAANGLDLQKMEWIKDLKQMAINDPELRAQFTRLLSEGDVMARLDTAYNEFRNGSSLAEAVMEPESSTTSPQGLREVFDQQGFISR